MAWPTKVLMVDPEFFNVEYIINPHMKDENGQLNIVDKNKARAQWTALKNKFEELQLKVEVIPGVKGLPDMVFCANQTLPFIKKGQLNIVLSHMNSEKRQPEVQYFEKWAKEHFYPVHFVKARPFEGAGDALWNYETERVFAGYGFRTKPDAYVELEKILDTKITTFELKNDRFYHLDTCLALLGDNTAAYVEEAFTADGIKTLRNSFQKLISVPLNEATNQLACNMCTPNGRDVLIQSGAPQTNTKLREAGFVVHEMETSEFIKSGGSVFCMKQWLP